MATDASALELELKRALSVAERAALLPPAWSSALRSEGYDSILDQWRADPVFQDGQVWDRRLAAEGLDTPTLRAVLATLPGSLELSEEQSTWLKDIEGRLSASEDRRSTALPPIGDEELRSGPLLVVAAPLVQPAYARLRAKLAELSARGTPRFHPDRIAADFYRTLRPRLALILARSLVLELQVARLQKQLVGDTAEERFQSFVQHLEQKSTQREFFAEYSVAARRTIELLKRWVDFALELILHLQQDAALIQARLAGGRELGDLTGVKTDLGDPHREGRSVSELTFSSGMRVIYKPRSLAAEQTFQQVLSWANERGFEPPLRVIEVIDRGSHGWVEFVRQEECESKIQLERFYQAQGGLLALLYALDARDFHYENVIAAGEHPVLIDLETLFQPILEPDELGAACETPAAALRRTVLNTGLLPGRIWTEDGGPGVDLSGLSEAEGQATSDSLMALVNVGSDHMQYGQSSVALHGAQNRPRLEGQSFRLIDYAPRIEDGFRKMLGLIVADAASFEAGPVQSFADVEMRVIFRPTHIYGKFLMESAHPDFLRDGVHRDVYLDRLWGAMTERPFFAKIVPYEKRDLEAFDIPIFHFKPGSKDVTTSGGGRLLDFFRAPLLERVRDRIRSLDTADIDRQCWIIHSTIEVADLANRPPSKPHYDLPSNARQITDDHLISVAIRFAERIDAMAFKGLRDAGWFTWSPVGIGHWNLEPMSPSLYDGLMGVALFLGQLGRLTADARWTDLSARALVTARYLYTDKPHVVSSVGGFNGWGGVVYGLARLGQLWNDETLLDEAIELLPRIQEGLPSDRYSDIIGGAAGAVVVLAALHRLRPDPRIIEVATQCGESILARAQRTDEGLGWVIPDSGPTPLAGMSHGAAGISWGLFALADLTSEDRYLQAAQEALRYERSLFSAEQRNWPDLREGDRPDPPQNDGRHYMMAWCHGAPGIGLARLASGVHRMDPEAIREIEGALNKTRDVGFGEDHSLCHGDLGNLELLLSAASTLNRRDLRDEARQVASRILAGVATHGWHSGMAHNIETPGLMVGWAGTGYQLLRLADPDRVPSVLTLQLEDPTP